MKTARIRSVTDLRTGQPHTSLDKRGAFQAWQVGKDLTATTFIEQMTARRWHIFSRRKGRKA